MRYVIEALRWLADGENWLGPSGIATRLGQHLLLTLLIVAISAAIAWPVGVAIGHRRRGAALVGALTGAARAIPTLGLLTIFAMVLGIGLNAPILALVILAIPSLLAGAYAGIQAIDPAIPAAAEAIGLSPLQIIFKVEIPLAAPVIVGGLRAAALQVVATATLAAYIADYGLGRFIMLGIRSSDYPQMLGGSIVVIGLAIVLEAVLAWLQRRAKKIADPAALAK
ncbi:MAG: ABC transporter permease subunit [Actinomycetaceae bacterium]|nr:ABC transporter permease subunit [Actinomycetaceae bacterium]